MIKRTVLFTIIGSLSVITAQAADQQPNTKPTIAKVCTNCHKAEPNVMRGYFDSVSFKTQNIQVKFDDTAELIKFDEDDLKVTNVDGKSGDGEFLRKTRKGHEIKVEFVEKKGVKTAVKVTEKPPVKIPDNMLIKTAELEKLVAEGVEKGKYFLFDSRPLLRFQDGFIPTAVNLPYPAFDKMTDKLPKDKNALIIFYCAGVTCNMSPASADKARKLGYTNVKVYKDGMPAWLDSGYGAITPHFIKEAWADKDIPFVLLDVRKDASAGFIKGAVSFPVDQAATLIKGVDVKKNAPVIVYDQNGSKDSEAVAAMLVKSGFKKVLKLNGGYDAWIASKYETGTGKLASKVVYVPKPRTGEISLDEFKKYVVNLPANIMILDVRSTNEGKAGMFKTAKLIPLDEIKERIAEIPKDKLIITQCNTGVLAEMAYNILKELGYTNIRFLNATTEFKKDGTYNIRKD